MSETKSPSWAWRLNETSKTVVLTAVNQHSDTVMDFVRYGMGHAAPRFNVDGLMQRADELAEVIPGREHHASWAKFINHPDALLIASAKDMAAELAHLREINAELVRACKISYPLLGEYIDHLEDEPEESDSLSEVERAINFIKSAIEKAETNGR